MIDVGSGDAPIPDTGEEATKYQALLRWFEPYGRVVVAFSGGVDSALVLKAAVEAKGPALVLAVTADSASLPRSELAAAQELARSLNVRHTLLPTRELDNSSYTANLGNRCYFCKSTLYEALFEELGELTRELGDDWVLVDGTNLDDLSDTRPGAKAAQEAGVRHPLLEQQLRKDEVRLLSRHVGLVTWDKPEMACLSSRIPAGVSVSEEKLRMVERAEEALHQLGFADVRVRYHELRSLKDRQGEDPLTLARIELKPSDIARAAEEEARQAISKAVRTAGFAIVVLDLEGYRRGGAANS